MNLDLTNIEVSPSTLQTFKMFAQSMLDRLCVGELRYGSPNSKKKYQTRLKKELKSYNSTGNAEHLINIANYCILEWIAPEHLKHHFDPTVKSVTRNDKSKMSGTGMQ